MKRKNKRLFKKFRNLFIFFLIITFVLIFASINKSAADKKRQSNPVIWKIRSIDTMKTSRDKARAQLYNPYYDEEIQKEVLLIKKTGANYIAIDTPYDNEFLPFLKRWINISRENNLQIWFRGNWSNWEGWFDYPKNLTPNEHILKNTDFITSHPDLFKDGDIFDPCPECENFGHWPQPSKNQDYLLFLQNQQKETQSAFKKINKKVITNINSIIGGRAKDILDKKTFKALQNTVTIDHYINNLQNINDYINYFTNNNTKIVFGEFGAPIPDINGNLNPQQQADFIDKILNILYVNSDKVIGLNYWVLNNGTTSLLDDNNNPKPAYDILSNYYNPTVIKGRITNIFNEPIPNAEVKTKDISINTNTNRYGDYQLAIPYSYQTLLTAGLNGYSLEKYNISKNNSRSITVNFILKPTKPNLFYKLKLFFKNITSIF